MTDTVSSFDIIKGPLLLVRNFENQSDGTGESGVTKIDLSTLLNYYKQIPASLNILQIKYDCSGMQVQIIADGSSPKVLQTLSGFGTLDFEQSGGINTANTGTNSGNVLFTTIGASANDTYNITLRCLIK